MTESSVRVLMITYEWSIEGKLGEYPHARKPTNGRNQARHSSLLEPMERSGFEWGLK
jgi:hypothetical protein